MEARIPKLRRMLEDHGLAVQILNTTAEPASAAQLAAGAAQNSDLVLACGGDGTVHDVLQGVAGTAATLGVIPFGTHNALAAHLGLALEPVRALAQLLGYTPRSIPLGQATHAAGQRWFLIMAGAGPDGALVAQTSSSAARLAKSRLGRHAYTLQAARLFLTRRFAPFTVQYRSPGASTWQTSQAAAMLVSRIPDLGGIFRGLTPHSALDHPHLSVQLVRAPAHLGLAAWFGFSRLGLGRHNPWFQTVQAAELRCTELSESSVLPAGSVAAQLDGEAAGLLPLHLAVQQDAVRLLLPPA